MKFFTFSHKVAGSEIAGQQYPGQQLLKSTHIIIKGCVCVCRSKQKEFIFKKPRGALLFRGCLALYTMTVGTCYYIQHGQKHLAGDCQSQTLHRQTFGLDQQVKFSFLPIPLSNKQLFVQIWTVKTAAQHTAHCKTDCSP